MTPVFPHVPPAGHEVRKKGEITGTTLILTRLLLLKQPLGAEQVIYDNY